MAEQQRPTHRGSVDYEQVGSDYMEKRQLKKGAAGWVLLAGLGVAYVISGDFAGWNFGLAEGGWGGLLIATILMATMYTCMVFALAELSSTISTAGSGPSCTPWRTSGRSLRRAPAPASAGPGPCTRRPSRPGSP